MTATTLNTYVGLRTFRKEIAGIRIIEDEHFVLVNGDARLMPSSLARTRYHVRMPTDLNWGSIGPNALALAHSILTCELTAEADRDVIAENLYVPFMRAHIAVLPSMGSHKAGTVRQWMLTSEVIRAWIDAQPKLFTNNKLAGF